MKCSEPKAICDTVMSNQFTSTKCCLIAESSPLNLPKVSCFLPSLYNRLSLYSHMTTFQAIKLTRYNFGTHNYFLSITTSQHSRNNG